MDMLFTIDLHPSHVLRIALSDGTILCRKCDHCSCHESEYLSRPCKKENDMTTETPVSKLVSGIPDQIEDDYYRMNPMTDDILIDGSRLVDGMIVLIEDPILRADKERGLQIDPITGELKDKRSYARLLTTNRWCRVSELRVAREVYQSAAMVTFIAEYSDGVKEKRRYAKDYAWLVKINSRPQPN